MSANRFAMHIAAAALLALPLCSSGRAELAAAAAPPGAGDGVVIEEVNFPISCSPTAQKAFNHAVWTLHSFWYPEALKGFSDIAKAEPNCAMAYWGVAMSRLKRPIAITPLPDDLRTARDALQRAADAKIATPRERAYLAARELLVGDGDPVGWHNGTGLYETAMAELAARQANDREATIFYALALNMAALPSDKSFSKQTKAAELLLVALSEQPNHPGLSHYLTYCLSLPSAAAPRWRPR